jgi:hypothetical protein
VSSLKGNNVHFHDSYLSLFLSKSKTDQYRQGSEVVISEGNTNACPLKVLRRYLVSANVDLESDDFVFKPAFRSKGKCALIHKSKAISYTRVRETVLSRLREVCGDANIGLHSMRAGGASMAARASVSDRCWKRHGRWKSDKVQGRLCRGFYRASSASYKNFKFIISLHYYTRSLKV